MKNLKKLLTLVLVVAMVLGIGVVGASAAFTDTANSPYQEAIDVLSGIGVINGSSATTFEPNVSLDRASAAKVLTYLLLGPVSAAQIQTAATQTFSDVPTSHWASGYIAYCASKGIISGAGDGTFNPNGTLKTVEFTKMLLVALGYNAEAQGYVGSNWAVNIASDALVAGVYDPAIPISTTAVITREAACQLAYKTLTATMVQYTGGTSVTVGDTTITTGATRSEVPNKASTYIDTDLTYSSAGTMQFVEKYFPLVKLIASVSYDVFGRPAYTWKNGAAVIGTYTNAQPAFSWTADHSYTAFDTTVATALATYTFDGTTPLYINGVATTPALNAAGIAALTGNGKLVEVYADAYNKVTRVVVVETVLGTITAKDVDTKTVTVSDGSNSVTLSALSSPASFGTAYAELYAKKVGDEVLLVTQDDGVGAITKILSVKTPTYVTGQYTKTSAGTYTVGGTAYGASANASLTLTLGETYTMTLDAYGYIINAGTPSTSDATYAFMVQGVKEGNALSGYTYSAKLVFADGITKWVKMASMDGQSTESALTTAAGITNKFVAYTEGTDGYALVNLTSSTESANTTITKNSPTFNGKTVSNSTIFLINTGTASAPVYTAYTGIKNVPTTTASTGFGLVSSGTYKFVIVTAVAPSAALDAVFVYSVYPISTDYVNASLTTATHSAIVNGVKTTVVAANDQFGPAAGAYTQGMYMGNTYTGTVITTEGSDSSTTIATDVSDVFGTGDANTMFSYTAAAQNITLNNGVLTAVNGTGNIVGVTDDNFVCYLVDLSEATCNVKTLSATPYALTGDMYFYVNGSGYVAYAIMVVA